MTRHNTRQRHEDAARATHSPNRTPADPAPHNAPQQPTQPQDPTTTASRTRTRMTAREES